MRLLQTADGYAGMVIHGAKQSPVLRDDDPDVLWRRLLAEVGKAHPNYFGFDGAKARFLKYFPKAFADPGYVFEERDYKDKAVARIAAMISEDQAGEAGPDQCAAAIRAFQAPNLVYPVEKSRIKEVLNSEAGPNFLKSAATFADGDFALGLTGMIAAIRSVTEENWATSVLVAEETFGMLKTKVGERWAEAKGFEVRRIDRRLVDADRLADDDPRIALSGVDKIEARKLMANVGFDCIVDAGLGRTAADFDRFRVSVFDQTRPIDQHFAGQADNSAEPPIPNCGAYQALEAEIGRCGTAEIAGASVAVPYVSALAAAVAVSRLIAVTSGSECPSNEVRRVSALDAGRVAPAARIDARGARHAGRPTSKGK